jgi:hypothetical protein
MAQQKVQLIKEGYGRVTYSKVIDTNFTELYTPPPSGSVEPELTVEDFFDLYNNLFFQIPATGEVNSHEYLVARSTEYLGGGVLTDNEKAYIEEINSLRQQLLEANTNFLNLNNIV